MAKKITNDEFKERAISLHGDLYDYSATVYKHIKEKVTIRCKVHGYFDQMAEVHLRGSGCPVCGNQLVGVRLRKSQDDFIKESMAIHNGKYDYALVEYNGAYSKVTINCPIHGLFEQIPHNHLTGEGCILCGNDLKSKHRREKPNGWNISAWTNASQGSVNFDSYKLYLVLMTNKDSSEKFLKIGRTYRTINKRFRDIPYNYEVVDFFCGDAKYIFKKEFEFKAKFKGYKWIPNVSFGGMHECFSYSALNALKKEFDDLRKIFR